MKKRIEIIKTQLDSENYPNIYMFKSKHKLGFIYINKKYINKNTIIVEAKYDNIFNYCFTYKKSYIYLFKLNFKYGFIDATGKIIIEPIFDNGTDAIDIYNDIIKLNFKLNKIDNILN
jgi:hypothetical protein